MARLDPGLAPGEVRELVLVFGGGCTLTGQVLDPEGASLAGLELWLVPGRGAGFLEWSLGEHLLKTRTDEHGRFAFADVAPGDWRLGPAPQKKVLRVEGGGLVSLSRGGAGLPDSDVAPLPRALFVAEGDVSRDVLVRDADRVPRLVWIEATCGDLRTIAGCATNGSFELGPLAPGEYELEAGRLSGRRSLPLRVPAGSEGVELELEPDPPR